MFIEKTASSQKTHLTMTQSTNQSLWIVNSEFEALLESPCYILG